MSLGICAIANHLPTSKAEYLVHSECSAVVDQEKLIDEMMARNSSLTRSDIMSCCNLLAETIFDLVRDGNYVNGFTGSYYMSASGTMASENEPFRPGADGNDHDMSLHHRTYRKAAAMLRLGTRTTRVEYFSKLAPALWSACTTLDGTPNRGEPGEVVKIEGVRMSFDKADPLQGVFFVRDAATRAADYHVVSSKLVVFVIPPSLEKGAYALVVRTRPQSKGLTEGRLKNEFVVE